MEREPEQRDESVVTTPKHQEHSYEEQKRSHCLECNRIGQRTGPIDLYEDLYRATASVRCDCGAVMRFTCQWGTHPISRLRVVCGECQRAYEANWTFAPEDVFGMSGNLSSGRVSAMLGALTYNAERERLESGEDKLTAHALGLKSAVKQVQVARNERRLSIEYAQVMREWHAARQETPMALLSRAQGGPRLMPDLEADPKRPGNDATVISLFSGGFGLDLGFLQLGCDLRAALDLDIASREVARANLPRLEFIHKDVTDISATELLHMAGLDAGELTFLIGGPPCQPFSLAGKRRALADPRAAPVSHFFRLVDELRPLIFVMEEVPGLLSARMNGRARGTVWKYVWELALATGYELAWHVLDAADFGAPQRRKRLIMIGVRDCRASLPETTHVSDAGQPRLFGGHNCLIGRSGMPPPTFKAFPIERMPHSARRSSMGCIGFLLEGTGSSSRAISFGNIWAALT